MSGGAVGSSKCKSLCVGDHVAGVHCVPDEGVSENRNFGLGIRMGADVDIDHMCMGGCEETAADDDALLEALR